MPTPPGTTATLPRPCAREVAIAIQTSTSFGRGVLQGISDWIHEHENWLITIDDRPPGEPIPRWFLRWKGHGLISSLEESSLPSTWRMGQRPVVHVRSRLNEASLPGVYPDDEAAVLLGISHLVDRGLHRLVFSPGNITPAKSLCDSVLRHATELGCHLQIHEQRPKSSRGRKRDDTEDGEALAKWLASLPKPVGVILPSDVRALRIIEACRRGGLAIPDDVAVVGIGGDEVLCGLSTPGLTSVAHDRSRIGQQAARMLDEAIRLGRTPSSVIHVPPSGIAIRRSSDVIAIEDADIRKAVHLIQKRACTDLSAADVATEVRVPRRLLDRKFQRILGRTIHDELQRMKVAEAKRLLGETDDKLFVISIRSGFSHAPQLCNVFKTFVGMSPMQYRKSVRSCRETAVPKSG